MSQILEMLQNSLFEHPCWTSCKSCRKNWKIISQNTYLLQSNRSFANRWGKAFSSSLRPFVRRSEHKSCRLHSRKLFSSFVQTEKCWAWLCTGGSAVTCSTVVIWQIWRGIAISQPQQWRLDFCIFPIWTVFTFASFFFFCSHERGLTLTLHFALAWTHVGSEMKERSPESLNNYAPDA